MNALWRHWPLILTFTHRQFQLRYRQSALGLIWAFIVPLATLGTGTLIFKEIARVDTGSSSYPVFTMSALVPWVFFASSVTFGVGSIALDKSLVQKLAFPRAALPLSMVGVSLLDFAISCLMFVIVAIVSGASLTVTALWVPALFLIEVVLVVGIVLLGSALNVFCRDIRLGIPLLMQLWLLMTPVMYPLDSVPPELRRWFWVNPMTGLVESFRRVLVDGRQPDPHLLIASLLGGVIAVGVGSWYFSATQKRFADVI